MKIVHVITGLNIGGAELMLFRLISHSTSSGSPNKHVVISLSNHGSLGPEFVKIGIDVVALKMSFGMSFFSGLFYLAVKMRREKPDIVQTWMYHSDLIGGLFARIFTSSKVVWGVRSTFIPQRLFSFTFWLVRLCSIFSYILPHAIICCANSSKDHHLKLGFAKAKMIAIPNGYDFSSFYPFIKLKHKARRDLGFLQHDLVLGMVGRYDPLKDHENFIRAASMLSVHIPNVRFCIIGRNISWTNKKLISLIDRHDLKDRIMLFGESKQVPYFLSAMDIFCLSSLSEAFPNVLVEAMAMNLPCVVTNAGDASIILSDNKNVVPVANPELLAKALLKLCLLNKAKREAIGKMNRIKVSQKYGIADIEKKYTSCYTRLLLNEG